ncbi:hypothetical protein B0H10DRAFT_1791765 [Mycena sp. CBHHK59/15]|nr:hypothetical protein B0H10DRAFT_1791765 [Mycena sp. CBHHK59/15]
MDTDLRRRRLPKNERLARFPITSHCRPPSASSSTSDVQFTACVDHGDYLRSQLCLPAGATVSLWSIKEPLHGEKPSVPLPMLMKLAIYGSADKQLTLRGIFNELAQRFTWFREHQEDDAWKNSVRHNLSLNKVFRRIPRPLTEPGQGCYWTLDFSEGEGNKRVRKRHTASKAEKSHSDREASAESHESASLASIHHEP